MIVNKKSMSIENLCIPSEFQQNIPTLFFDIETTGLYWKRSHLYLIGAACLEGDTLHLTQYLAQKPAEEEEILQEFYTLAAGFQRVVHYNGEGFDLPYLKHKAAFYERENFLDNLESVDLFRCIRPLKKLMNFSQMKQKDVENFMGYQREDPFSGGELIEVYQEYLRTADERLLKCLLLHNAEDIEGMVRILPILNYLRVMEGSVKLQSAELTDSGEHGCLALEFSYESPALPREIRVQEPPYRLLLTPSSGRLETDLEQGMRKLFYPNYKDYFYLPLEDRAVHKSVGIYVDKEYREKAKASNCYQNVEGLFLPQPEQLISPVLIPEYQSRAYCTPFSPDLLDKADLLESYLRGVLKFLS